VTWGVGLGETRVRNAKKRLASGVQLIGTLLAAAAVMRILARAFGIPLNGWLSAILTAYHNLLHPVVDYTVGLVPAAFGYQLLPVAKDAMIFYGVLGASLYRAIRSDREILRISVGIGAGKTELETQLEVALLAALWPIVVVMSVAATRRYLQGRRSYRPYYNMINDRLAGPSSLLAFLKELLFVLVVVAFCMLLNASGVIHMPE
jgi:hypothetical protein